MNSSAACSTTENASDACDSLSCRISVQPTAISTWRVKNTGGSSTLTNWKNT